MKSVVGPRVAESWEGLRLAVEVRSPKTPHEDGYQIHSYGVPNV